MDDLTLSPEQEAKLRFGRDADLDDAVAADDELARRAGQSFRDRHWDLREGDDLVRPVEALRAFIADGLAK